MTSIETAAPGGETLRVLLNALVTTGAVLRAAGRGAAIPPQ
jgi:hypothetical protein